MYVWCFLAGSPILRCTIHVDHDPDQVRKHSSKLNLSGVGKQRSAGEQRTRGSGIVGISAMFEALGLCYVYSEDGVKLWFGSFGMVWIIHRWHSGLPKIPTT